MNIGISFRAKRKLSSWEEWFTQACRPAVLSMWAVSPWAKLSVNRHLQIHSSSKITVIKYQQRQFCGWGHHNMSNIIKGSLHEEG